MGLDTRRNWIFQFLKRETRIYYNILIKLSNDKNFIIKNIYVTQVCCKLNLKSVPYSCTERSRYKNCHLELSSFLCFEGFACVPLWTEAGSDYRPSSAGVAPMQGIRFGIRDGCLRDSTERNRRGLRYAVRAANVSHTSSTADRLEIPSRRPIVQNVGH